MFPAVSCQRKEDSRDASLSDDDCNHQEHDHHTDNIHEHQQHDAKEEAEAAAPAANSDGLDDHIGRLHANNAHVAERRPDFILYINDGIYGSMNNVIFDHVSANPIALRRREIFSDEAEWEVRQAERRARGEVDKLYSTTIFGPTCDSLDIIAKNVPLPLVHVGDWVYFENFGSYTLAIGTQFNGFTAPTSFTYMNTFGESW
jgi:hypothetical protein